MRKDLNVTGTEQRHAPVEPGQAGARRHEWAWLLLVVGAVGNTVASAAASPVLVHLVLGLVTAVAAGVLVAPWLRGRR